MQSEHCEGYERSEGEAGAERVDALGGELQGDLVCSGRGRELDEAIP